MFHILVVISRLCVQIMHIILSQMILSCQIKCLNYHHIQKDMGYIRLYSSGLSHCLIHIFAFSNARHRLQVFRLTISYQQLTVEQQTV